ncbi:unnamed protein product [Clonostachys byssicola]|uniref:Uncharacterized protein n=1 Tax=Clonostachys byssicola TaxID=160290 RepID=A0A9N9Y7J0_9HYPO|nr:unnamed protein product [Clonostachys byssicola]
MVALKHLGAAAVLCLSLVPSGLAQFDGTSNDLAARDDYEQIIARGIDNGLDARDILEELYARGGTKPNNPGPKPIEIYSVGTSMPVAEQGQIILDQNR